MFNKQVIIESLRNLNKPSKITNKNAFDFKEGGSKKEGFVSAAEGVDTPIYKAVRVGASPIEGKGLFAEQAIKKGDVIGISHIRKTFMKDGEEYQAPFPSTVLGYYNHSEEPNVYEVDKGDHILMVAGRDIPRGQEITSDYSKHNIEDLEVPEDFKRGGATRRPKIPKGKSPGSYSRSFEATNKFFAENPLFKKAKSRKNKIFDPRAKYYAKGGITYNNLPETYKEALKNFVYPNVIDDPERTGYNSVNNTISYDSQSPIENMSNDWWREHELFHDLQNQAGGMSTSGVVGQRPNPYVASDESMHGYYDRRDADVNRTIDNMISEDPNLQFIPRNKLAEGSQPGFIGAEDLQYSDPSTLEGEARQYEQYIREGNPSIFPKKKDGGISLELTEAEIKKYVDGGYIVEDLPKAAYGREKKTYVAPKIHEVQFKPAEIQTFNPSLKQYQIHKVELPDRIVPGREYEDVKHKMASLRKDLGISTLDHMINKYVPGAAHPISLIKDSGIVIDPSSGRLFDSNTRYWLNREYGFTPDINQFFEQMPNTLARDYGTLHMSSDTPFENRKMGINYMDELANPWKKNNGLLNLFNEPVVGGPLMIGMGMMGKPEFTQEIKNPDYFTQLLNTYDTKRLSYSSRKYYQDLINSVKNQNGLATERQFNELQRLKTGNFDFGKRGYAKGGLVKAAKGVTIRVLEKKPIQTKIQDASKKILNNPTFSGVKKDWSGAITGIYNPYFKTFDAPLANMEHLTKMGDLTNQHYNNWDKVYKNDLFQTEAKQFQLINPDLYEIQSRDMFDEYMRKRKNYLDTLDLLESENRKAEHDDLFWEFVNFDRTTPVPIDPVTMQGLDLKTLTRISDESKLIRDLELEGFDFSLDKYNLTKAMDQQKIDAYKNTPLSYKLFGLSPGYKMFRGINAPYETDAIFPFHTSNTLGKQIYNETGSGVWDKLNLLDEFHPWGSKGEKTLMLQDKKNNYNILKDELLDRVKNMNKNNFDEGNLPYEEYAQGGQFELGDTVDKSTMERLKKLGYTFEEI